MLLDYIVSNVFYILGMAHRVHYVTRIDWTPRKLHSNAVFRHSLAPDKLEPPHSVPISFKTQYCSHRSAPTMSFSIRRILQHLHTHTLNPGIQIPVHWHTVHLISFQSVHFYPHPFSGHPFPTVPIYLILKYWYAICPGIVHPISVSWYAIYPGVDHEISPYRYAEYLDIDHQIPPYRYAVYSDIVHHIPPQ